MTPHAITFAASASLANAASRWLEPVLAAWPVCEARPGAASASLDELSQLRDTVPSLRGAPRVQGPILAVFEDEPLHLVAVLADRLRMTLRPAVFLAREPGKLRRAIPGDAAIIEAWDAPPAQLAAMLYALAQRQPAVQHLADELFVMQASQGGLDSQVRLLHEELQLASVVQREFLPTELPRVDGLDFGVVFRPAGFVSGDIFGVQPLGDASAAFFVADAVGHGVPAALLTVALSRLLLARAGSTPLVHPGAALARLNEELCAHPGGPHRYATAVCGMIDGRSGRVTLSGAGHPRPLCIAPDAWREIETEGPMLGVFDTADFPEASFHLDPGETLFLYSDGLDDAMAHLRRTGLCGQSRLAAELLRRGNDPARPVGHCLRELGSLIDDQGGSLHQRDDVTVLAIRIERRAAARAA